MGKQVQQNLHQQHSHDSRNRTEGSSGFFCERCSMELSTILKEFSFRCFFVLMLSLSLLVSVIFWILPHRTVKIEIDSFDAEDSIKLSATVQAYFRLQRPVLELVPLIGRLQYDINEEIGVPNAKVAILSMHQSGASNWTDVVFGVLSDPINVPLNQVSLSVLKSSLIELFFGESNLTLTASLFGQPSMFEILKFPGGITVIPVPYASIWHFRQIFFSFTLNNSIAEILDNLSKFRDQLKLGLGLRTYEYIVVQITNINGSTIDFPVAVEASVISDSGSLPPQRLQQLAQTINNSPENLGLDNMVFGKVKSVILSTYLKCTLQTPPTPSPAPSPELNDFAEPPITRSLPPAYSPSGGSRSPIASLKCQPHHTLPPVNSPAPSTVTADPLNNCRRHGSPISPSPSPSQSNPCHPIFPSPSPSHSNLAPYIHSAGPHSQLSPSGFPSPQNLYGSTTRKGSVSQLLVPSPSAPSPSSLAVGHYYGEIWWLGISGLLIFHLL